MKFQMGAFSLGGALMGRDEVSRASQARHDGTPNYAQLPLRTVSPLGPGTAPNWSLPSRLQASSKPKGFTVLR